MRDAAEIGADGAMTLATPEHVAVGLRLGDLGSRAVALFIDMMIQVGVLIVLTVPLALMLGIGAEVLGAVLLLATFVVRTFYFTFFEITRRGRTPGKKVFNLRVVSRDGGPLSAGQLFARNLTRELETFLPLTVLLAPDALVPDSPWWVSLAGVVWVLLLTLLPFFNRHRSRLGDLLGGTLVVQEPAAELLGDLVGTADQMGVAGEIAFTREQLDLYGIRELQVLEDLLRREHTLERERALELVAEKVRAKIGWTGGIVQSERFLTAFYAAQRGRLESRMLFGERRERKVR